ncbi:MAG: UbiA family prenyltransferase [Chloroflexi bacterium]|nr:UbiA family prenyltransferase [Chloroflexota bacterium]
METTPLREQIRGLIQLTRWQEYLTFVIPLTLLGALLAARPNDVPLDWRLVAVMLANILVVAYAFMINDIEDAPDDARDPARAARNPISSGRIGVRIGYAACLIVAVATLIMFALGGLEVFLIGVVTLMLSHLYSWRPVRLKAWPVTDVVSHSLMLSGLLLLAGYFIYDSNPGVVWLVAASVTLMSVYGQLYNQIRDYEMDKAAGLRNTAILLGERRTYAVMYLSVAVAAVCLLAALLQGIFPLWLGVVVLISIPVSMLISGRTDMRGGEAVDISGAAQTRVLVIVNLTVTVWLAQVLVTQIVV